MLMQFASQACCFSSVLMPKKVTHLSVTSDGLVEGVANVEANDKTSHCFVWAVA
jgi:hypothetical protein